MLDHMLDQILSLDHISLLAIGVAISAGLIIVLRWTGQKVVIPRARLVLQGDGAFDYPVECHDEYRPLLVAIAGRSPANVGEECVVELKPETGRQKASTTVDGVIAVVIEGTRIGQIPPRDAPLFHDVLKGHSARCNAVVAIRSSGGEVSVRLDIGWPPNLA